MRGVSLTLVAAAGTLVCAPEAWAGPAQTTPSTQPPVQTIDLSTDVFSASASSSPEPEVSISYVDATASAGAPDGQAVAAARPRTCELWAAPGGPGSMGTENRPLAPVQGDLVDGAWYYQTRRYTDTGDLASSRYWQFVAGAPGFGPDLAALAASAYDRIEDDS